jgi:hypothetical protein
MMLKALAKAALSLFNLLSAYAQFTDKQALN